MEISLRGGQSILNLVIVNSWERRRGRGAEMLHQFEQEARKARSTSIKLIIMPPQGESKETAIKFFEKHGYKLETDFGFGPFYIKEL